MGGGVGDEELLVGKVVVAVDVITFRVLALDVGRREGISTYINIYIYGETESVVGVHETKWECFGDAGDREIYYGIHFEQVHV